MSAHDLIFCNPPLDHNRPASGVVFTNVTAHPLCVALSLELTRAPSEPLASVTFQGLDNPSGTHTLEFTGPATVIHRVIAVVVRPGDGVTPRDLSLALTSPGTICELRVLSLTPCPP